MAAAHDDLTSDHVPGAASARDGASNTGGLQPKESRLHAQRTEALSLDAVQRRAGARYRVVSLAGAGGMGEVVEAIDTVLQRRVALKFLRDDGTSSLRDAAVRDRVIHEARAMAGLRHPGVCRVLEVSLDPPGAEHGEEWRPYLVMEWVQGVECTRWARSLVARDRAAFFRSVVDAVAAMHGAGLLHLDLKPANILVDSGGVPIVVDFGLSRSRVAGSGATIAGGTPGWSAPEQFRAGAEVGGSADVFALGVLLYELLTGRRPFEGASAAELVDRTAEGRPALPESIDPDVDPALQRICLVALDPDPRRRYSDASMLAADLRRHAEGKPVLARPRQLLEEFAQQVELTVEAIDRWRRQGMATDDEARGLVQVLGRLKRPESPWILESRRLSLSQVSLYFGGWCLLIALTVGIWRAERSIEQVAPALVWLIPFVLVAVIGGLGWVLHRRGEWRIAFGFLLTASLAIPASIWNSLRVTGWMAADPEQRASQLFPSSSLGLSNDQMLATGASWFVAAVLFRCQLPSAAFAFLGSIALYATWMPLWLRMFLTEDAGRLEGGLAAAWSLMAGVGLVAIAWWRDAADTRAAGDAQWKSRISDAGAIMAIGLTGTIVGLSAISWWAPELMWLSMPAVSTADSAPIHRAPSVEARAASFLIDGGLLLLLSMLLSLRRTPLRDRAARALRWIVPSFILLPIAWLEFENGSPGWQTWLVILAVGSIVTVYASVWQQWRPFLLTGLLYFGDFVVRTFLRIDEHWGETSWPTPVFFLSLVAVGLALMIAAWRLAGRRVTWSRVLPGTSVHVSSSREG